MTEITFTITAQGSMIRLLAGGRVWIRWQKSQGGGLRIIMDQTIQSTGLILMG